MLSATVRIRGWATDGVKYGVRVKIRSRLGLVVMRDVGYDVNRRLSVVVRDKCQG